MLERILFDNPEIDEEVNRRCLAEPAYQALRADCAAKWQALQQALAACSAPGSVRWQALQRALTAYSDAESLQWGFLALAYYHMGLGVRQEVLSSLSLTAQSAP